MQLPLQYRWDSEPVFPLHNSSQIPPQFSTLPGLHTIDILIPQAAKPWAKPAGGPVAIVRRHAHDSLLACIQSLLSEPSFSLLCFPFPPCSAGCRMHTHTHELQNSAPPRLPDSPPLHTSPSLNFAPRAETNHCSRPTGQPLDQQDAQTEPFFIILSHPSPP